MQLDDATGARRRRAYARILLVFEQGLPEGHPIAGADEHRGLEAVRVEAERGDPCNSRRHIDQRRRLSGEREIEPFRASVKARWPSF